MQQQAIRVEPIKTGLFGYLALLTLLFFFMEVSFFLQRGNIYLGEFSYISKHLQIPIAIIPGILYFIGAQFFVHSAFTVVVWAYARLVGKALLLPWPQIQRVGFGLWVIAIITILIANQYFYPISKFALLTQSLIPDFLAPLILVLLAGALLVASMLAILGLLKYQATLTLLLGTIAIFGVVNMHHHSPRVNDAATSEKPNVILIGVDALRPDFLGYFGYAKHTPFFDDFLNHATVFTDALTPLARTFPAWVSILTGSYPTLTGMRFNLADQANLDVSQTLPAILQQHGYKTIYATDETRFSNIDKSFGFDQVVTPPIGVNDFLVGEINDFPMSNLLVNTWLGKWLFPYSYGNRPVYITYDPNSFLNLLNPVLQKSRSAPLFLAVHFCLPHFPYFWGHIHVTNGKALGHYQAAVQRADQQVQAFLSLLQKNHVLDHSIVVLLSDHGEAIELHGDRATAPALFIPNKNASNKKIPRFYPRSMDTEGVDQSVGHGTDVLGLSQYHTLLAVRLYGLDKQDHKNVTGLVSLLDIKPTILNLLHISAEKNSGKVLTDFITGKDSVVSAQQDFFAESDFSPQAVRSVHPEARKILFEGIDYFQINPKTTRLTVKKSMAELILSSKQYADFYQSWVLALYPQNKQQMTPILVNLQTGQWTNDLRTPFAKASPARHMLHALKDFYGKDLTLVRTATS